MDSGPKFHSEGHEKYKALLKQTLRSTWSFKSPQIPPFKVFVKMGTACKYLVMLT